MKAQMKAADRSGARLAHRGRGRKPPPGPCPSATSKGGGGGSRRPAGRRAGRYGRGAHERRSSHRQRRHWCGELTLEHDGPKCRSAVGWPPAGGTASTGVRGPAGSHRAGAVVVDGAHDLGANRSCASPAPAPAARGTENPSLGTGEVEVGDCEVEVVARAETPPFPVGERTDVDEVLRQAPVHRPAPGAGPAEPLPATAPWSTPRFARPWSSRVSSRSRPPMLMRSTPEGRGTRALRLHPGHFYALPQSPQLFKQLCMVGGSIATTRSPAACGTRTCGPTASSSSPSSTWRQASWRRTRSSSSHRRPCWRLPEAVGHDVPAEIPRITWEEAAERYGTDKPDLRFGMELVELADVFSGTEFRAFQAECVKGIRVPGGVDKSRNELDGLIDRVKSWGAGSGLDAGRGRRSRFAGPQVPVGRGGPAPHGGALGGARGTSCCSWPTSGAGRQILGRLRVELGPTPRG